MRRRRQQKDYGLLHDWRRDLATFRRLKGKERAQFLWDYYRYFFVAVVFTIFALFTAVNIIHEGQKECRLRVCAVLNTEDSCSDWFDAFAQELSSDGKSGAVSLNEDQPFDYDNMYYYVQEMEVLTTISSGRMDAAICNADLYEYLLAINACLPLDSVFSEAELRRLSPYLVYSTANLTEDENGQIDPSAGIDGCFALDLTQTAFGSTYNNDEPLYAVIISNTDHTEDAVTLLKQLTSI